MFSFPLAGPVTVTAPFGATGSFWSKHKGVDLICPNKNILATCDGVVSVVAFDTSGGQYISIKPNHNPNIRHLFFHLVKGSQKVKTGDKVKAGQVIGTMGATGVVSGVHLHFEIRRINGVSIDPCVWLGIPNKSGTYQIKPIADYNALVKVEKDTNTKLQAELKTVTQAISASNAKLKELTTKQKMFSVY